MTLRIADGLALPLDAATEKLAFIGRTGQGKSYAATKLAELMLDAGAQIIALDPTSIWYGLRVNDESLKHRVYVFGGLHGDLPLQPTAGALIADTIVDHGISAVLDVGQWIPSEQQRFAKDFAERFFHRKKAAPSAVHLFLEECQEFVPQNPMGAEAQTLHEYQRLLKLGRNFGIGASLISQRPQEVNKKALNQSGTLFVFQLTGPQERKAINDWVKDQDIEEDIQALLPKLRRGEPHVWSPTFLHVSKTVMILPKVTGDVSSTPKVGAAVHARKLSKIDVAKLSTDLAATIERAKADDPRELRRQIADLQRQLHQAQQAKQAAPEAKTVEVPVISEKQLIRLEASASAIGQLCERLSGEGAALRTSITEVLAAVAAVRPWWRVLEFDEEPAIDVAETAFRKLAMQYHPDRPGGSAAMMAEISEAIATARAARP